MNEFPAFIKLKHFLRRFGMEVWSSVTSVKFYQEVIRRSLREGLVYFSFLILVVTLILTVRFSFDIAKGLAEFEMWSRENLPDIVIEKGEVFVDVPQPWQEEAGDFVVIIDTTGEIEKIDDYYPHGLLLMKDRLLLKRGPYETRRYDLSKVESFRFDPETARRWRQVGQWFLPPLLAFFLFFYFWVGKFVQVFLFSLISLLANWAMKKGLSYKTLFTIGLYAMTPPLLLLCGTVSFGLQIRFFDLIYLSIYAALLVTVILQVQPKIEPEKKIPWISEP